MKTMKKKDLVIRVRQSCAGSYWSYAIYDGRKRPMYSGWLYSGKSIILRRAKAMAKCLGIKYNPKILRQHGC